MNLHDRIMNIPVDNPESESMSINETIAFRLGHRIARHAAAEIANEEACYIEELEQAARLALKDLEFVENEMWNGIKNEAAEKIRSALRKVQYVICDGHSDNPLYWNNEQGWVLFEDATRFSPEERFNLNLPIQGRWETV